jgi:regulatory protein
MTTRRGSVGAGRERPAPASPGGDAADRANRAKRAKDANQPADPATAARDVCIRLLEVRPRTRAELDTALRRRGVDDDVITEVLDRYSDVGMIDDEAFARAWVTSRHHSKGLARRALAGELRRKGVADDDLGAALDELDGDTEVETARALVERRLRVESAAAQRATTRRARRAVQEDGEDVGEEDEGGETPQHRRKQATVMRKLVGMLARKGYPPGLAFRVVKEAMDDDAAELLEPDAYVEDPDDFDQLRS